ncbi:Aste57867_17586 [Aphanomyces stellatus]|uniref:Aste57867_17586 protein n=1 Tax=Aphanomyces stellatus TaxID=120398 RepID=A0A485LBQ7_9STRA|nr:hypothetical protein As57867_017526 [Aphanomyces stellatus]VFT94337.1 Aste57867_17586 [Aphanomyces stellatus]
MDGISILKPMNASSMPCVLDPFMDDELDASSLMFTSHRTLPKESRAASGTDDDWDDSKLCISIDHESNAAFDAYDSVFDLAPSTKGASKKDRKRKDSPRQSDVSDPPHTEKKARRDMKDDNEVPSPPPPPVRFTAVHNDTMRFSFTTFGSTARTLASMPPFSSASVPFEITGSTYVSRPPPTSTMPVPATPRVRID